MPEPGKKSKALSRRAVVIGGAASGLAAATVTLLPWDAWATPEEAKILLAAFAPGTPKPGKITIKAPEIAENGNTVPITITVDSPMTETDYVKSIVMVAENNPAPGVIRLALTPALAKAELQFRMRLAQTQRVIAVAQMSDGSLWQDARVIKVTIGGCGG
jgi:sulfur-oxidizing protein SoxY